MSKEVKPTEQETPAAEAQPQTAAAASEKPKFPYVHPKTGMTVAYEKDGIPCTATGIDCRPEAEWREKLKPQKKSNSSNSSNPTNPSTH